MNIVPSVFNYGQSQVRTALINGEPWFVARDICEILEHSNSSKAVKDLVDDDDLTASYPIIDSMGRTQNATIVNESGLYSLILGSRKPEAKKFKRWVTHEVIPSIRKTGSYSIQQTLPQNYVEALKALVVAEEQKAILVSEKLAIEAKLEADRPMVLFAESLQVSQDSILIGELAKVLKQNGIDIGQNRLFQLLRSEGYLIKSGEQYNTPTQRSMDLKIMEIKTGTRNSSDGTIKITRTPKITGKGQIYFVNKFKALQQAN